MSVLEEKYNNDLDLCFIFHCCFKIQLECWRLNWFSTAVCFPSFGFLCPHDLTCMQKVHANEKKSKSQRIKSQPLCSAHVRLIKYKSLYSAFSSTQQLTAQHKIPLILYSSNSTLWNYAFFVASDLWATHWREKRYEVCMPGCAQITSRCRCCTTTVVFVVCHTYILDSRAAVVPCVHKQMC